MQQESNQLATKGDINKFKEEIKSFIKDGFKTLDKKIDYVEENTNERFDKVEEKIDNLENKTDRRMSVVEDRVHILKNVVEKGFKTKVAW